MGRFCLRYTQVRAGQSLALPQRAMALSSAASEGRSAGTEQPTGGAQHQALRNSPQELPIYQYPVGCPGQCGDLQSD